MVKKGAAADASTTVFCRDESPRVTRPASPFPSPETGHAPMKLGCRGGESMARVLVEEPHFGASQILTVTSFLTVPAVVTRWHG